MWDVHIESRQRAADSLFIEYGVVFYVIRSLLLALSTLLYAHCSLLKAQHVRVGAEVLIDKHLDSILGNRVGIVCNHTAVLPNGVHLVDTLLKRDVHVTALFAPEHGIRGEKPAGEMVEHQIDLKTGLPVYSLYGGTRKPQSWMLDSVDVLVFDMQDVGARFYTYASTMAYVMASAAENGKKFIVLDRPNPINGVDVEGPTLDMTLHSFLGLFPIPIRHGLTLGEIARMIVDRGFVNPSNVDLTVIPMEGWKRTMWYDETGLPWVAPSPNMITLNTATVYPGTCLFEATNISEGRGTQKPFEYIGAPKLNPKRFIARMKKYNLSGITFAPIEFTPKPDPISAPDPKYKNKLCHGVEVRITDRKAFKPVLTGVMMLAAMRELYPKSFEIKKGFLTRLIGDEDLVETIAANKAGLNVLDPYKSQIEEYKQMRKKYLLY